MVTISPLFFSQHTFPGLSPENFTRQTPKMYPFSREKLNTHASPYSLNKKEWICSLFKEWILEKSEIRVNLEWIWSEHLCYSLILEWPQGSLGIPEWSLWSLQIHSNFTLISLFSKIHSLKSEHNYSLFFLRVCVGEGGGGVTLQRKRW